MDSSLFLKFALFLFQISMNFFNSCPRFLYFFFRVNFFNRCSRNRRRRCVGGYHLAVEQEKNIYPPCGQQFHNENKPFSLFSSFMMAGETHFVFRFSVGFFAVFVVKLVILVNS